nr:urea transporter [Brevibacterium luteolum]
MNRVKQDWRDTYSGTFDLTRNVQDKSSVLGVLDSTLRGIGQIFLINNPITGFLLVIAVATNSIWAAVLVLAGSAVSVLTAMLLGYDESVVRLGFYSFNGALFGVLGAVFLIGPWVLTSALLSLLAASVSVPIMKITIEVLVVKFEVPALSLTFGVLGVLMLLLLPATIYGGANVALLQPVERYAKAPDPHLREAVAGGEVGILEGMFNATFRGIGQVVLMDSALVGILIVVAIAAATRIGAVMVILGSCLGAISGLAIGADGYEIFHGLWGYNAAVVGVGLFGIVLEVGWKSFIATGVACLSSGLLYGALSQLLAPWGVIPLSLPLVMIIIGTTFALKDSRVSVLSIPDYSNAEKRIRIRKSMKGSV